MMNHWTNAMAALNVMVVMGVFEKMPKEGRVLRRKSFRKLAEGSSALRLVVRFIRILVGFGVVETGEDSFSHTRVSRENLPGASVDLFRMFVSMSPTYLSLRKYFSARSTPDLYNPPKTPFSYSHNSEGKTFYQGPFLPTLGMYPFSSLRGVEAEKDRLFMIDVGGRRGHMLNIISKDTDGSFKTPLILQNRPEALENISQADISGIQKIAHDFYTSQPVKNAYIYYLCRILHNYQDETFVSILKNIASAMGPKSRILIGELVLPVWVPVAGEMIGYWKDMVKLIIGGKERSAKAFAKILEAQGWSW
ncbi:S-adenosyl-L-methionine-dependent methyltransferase [Acephala macrosclerotiorum]|nr:S-adenosyl-L-methionine-dependent methyltransferase [Acephala macrosclerotiorum]